MKHLYQRIVFAFLIAAIPLAVAAQEAFTMRDVDVFAGPSSEYPPVATLPPGTPVTLAGCLSDWSWCDVSFGNDRGWVYAGDLGYPYQNNRVVILDYGPRLALPLVTFSLDSYWGAHYRARPFFRERAQWVSRVHIQANRGGTPPHARSAQAAQPQAAQPQPAPAQQPRVQAARPQPPAQPQSAQVERERRDREQAARSTPQQQSKEALRPQEQAARPAQRAPQPEASVTQQREQRAHAPEPKPSQAMTREQPAQPQAGRQSEGMRAAPEAQRQPEAKRQPERERPKEEGRESAQQ
jgi:uncharacterized protein YraI